MRTIVVKVGVITFLGMMMALCIRSYDSKMLRQLAKRDSERSSNEPKVAIYMTSHMSYQHRKFLRRCWIEASKELISAFPSVDLILYVSNDPPSDVISQLPFKTIKIHRYENGSGSNLTVSQIKQQGAIQAITDALAHHWWDDYEWIVRLNPDVLLRNISWLQQVLMNDSVDGVFHDCFEGIYEQENRIKLHTDFFAVRPRSIDSRLFHADETNAEQHLTRGVANLLESNRVAWIPGAESPYPACRIQGDRSPVIHNHQMWKQCSKAR